MWRYVALLVLVPTLSVAQGFKHREKSPDAPPLPVIEYYCTDATGARRELGEVICITASCQTILARCEMSLNNPMWREIQKGCPAASLDDPLQLLDPGFDPGPVNPLISHPKT
jgi:hypothetical protein